MAIPPRLATAEPGPAVMIWGPVPLSARAGLLALRKAAHENHKPASGMVTDTRMVTAVASRRW